MELRHNTDFSVRYLTADPVPIRDIIASLEGAEMAIRETGKILPLLIDGLTVEKVEIKVREISQESPLRELFAIALFVSFQEQLQSEIPPLITDLTGVIISERFDAIVTIVTLIVVFYGAGALKDLVFGKGKAGAASAQLDGLIAEVSPLLGMSERRIREILDERYSEPTLLRRITKSASRFFTPSKQQNSSPMEVNGREIERQTIMDIPAEYLADDASSERPSRFFKDAIIELRSEDKDHSGKGWAAIVRSISPTRLKMKLMEDVSTLDVWGKDTITGDISVIYDKVGSENIPKEIHLHVVTSG